MNKRFIVLFLLLVIILTVVCGCAPQAELSPKTKTTFDYFGTASVLAVYDNFTKPDGITRLDSVWDDICALLSSIDSQLSVSVDSSDVSRFNSAAVGEPISVGEHTLNVVLLAKNQHKLFPDYDPSVYPLVDLWALTPRFNSNSYSPSLAYDRERVGSAFGLPDSKYLNAFTRLVDFDAIVVDQTAKTLTKTKSVFVDGAEYFQKLDLGGIAKGYAVEQVMKIIAEYGYKYGYFSCGSSSVSVLERPNSAEGVSIPKAWSLGVQSPRFDINSTFIDIFCKNVAISTSGDYQHCYFVDDVRYNHIINVKNGMPIGVRNDVGIAAVTLIGDNAAELDALSTSICLMTIDSALNLLNSTNFDKYAVITLWRNGYDYCEVVTNMPADMYKIKDERFVLSSRLDGGKVVYTGKFYGIIVE